MILEALFGPGNYSPWDLGATEPDIAAAVDGAIESSGNLVEFNFKGTYPLNVFYQIVAQPWASILNKDWAISLGAWDGDYNNWAAYNDPAKSPFDDPEAVENGSGPYYLDYVDFIQETWRIIYFPAYWRGWPAPGCSDYVEAVREITVYGWSDRKLLFLSDDPEAQVDLSVVERAYIYDDDLVQVIRDRRVCFMGNPRMDGGLPTLQNSHMFYNFDVPDNSPYAGDFQWTTGIPADFFADEHVRYGFAYSFNWAKYITEVFLGEVAQPATPLIRDWATTSFTTP